LSDQPKGLFGVAQSVQEFILFFLMVAITFLVFAQVLLRYVFKAPLMGIEEILLFPTVWLYMVGAANASIQRTQIVCRVLEVFVKNRLKSIYLIRSAASFLSFGVALWLDYWAYDYLKYALRVPRVSSSLYIPLIYAEIALFIAMILITLYTLVEGFYNLGQFHKAPAYVADAPMELEP